MTKPWKIFPWIEFRPEETTLAWGLIFLAVTAALFHFVMCWLRAPLTVPLTILLLVRGISQSRRPGSLTSRQCSGVGLLFLGMLSLSVAAFAAASLSWQLAVPSKSQNLAVFGFGKFAWCAVSLLCSTLLLTKELSFWTDWPPSRIRIWRRIILTFPFFTILIHQFIAALGGPLTA